LPHFLSNPFNPFMSFYHNPLQGVSSPSRNSDAIRKSPMERLADSLDSTQNNSRLRDGLSGYPGATTQSSVGRNCGSGDFWRGGGGSMQTTTPSNLKQPTSNLPPSTTNPPQSTPSSTSLYAAVMAAAAVASWGGQAMPTPTPASNSLAPSDLVKTASSAAPGEVEVMSRRNKPMDTSKNPYSPRLV
uniref:AT-hook motif nuclear-localized protein n=1 Tax=Rodentolepis nana TaxID=102285 RepID=A0A0R3TQP8_RODNA